MDKENQLEILNDTVVSIINSSDVCYAKYNEIRYYERAIDYLAGVYHVGMNSDLEFEQLTRLRQFIEMHQQRLFETIHIQNLLELNERMEL